MQLITLAEVLRTVHASAEPFSVVFSTADRQRRTGGELVRLAQCVVTGRDREPQAAAPAPAAEAAPPRAGRYQPRHRAHGTLNVTVLPGGKPRKLHVRLITEFNGQKVRW